MKLRLSAADRIRPAGDDADSGGRWVRFAVYGVVTPFTVAVVALSAWYIATGQTPFELFSSVTGIPRIELPMPPPLRSPADSLLRPPGGPGDAKPAQPGASPAAPPAAAPAPVPAPAPAPAAPGKQGAVPPAKDLPTVSLPPTPAAATSLAPPPPEPSMPGGDPLPPPTFGQLPARVDVKPLPGDAPLPELLRTSAYGPLPIAARGKEPSTAYARPFAGNPDLPRVAVVVVGLGVSRDATEAAILKLPSDISLSFSPYAGGLDGWTKRARANGHEVLLDLPLEPPNFPMRDAGPLAVLAQHTPAKAVERMETVLGKATGYVGVAAGLHSPVAARDLWAPLLQNLRGRGLLFVGDGLVGVPDNALPPAASVALVADETPFRAAIDARLARLVAAAQRDGKAVAYVSARPVTFERLLAWANTLPEKGVQLAPVSAVVRR